ncbi:hypothetical protein GWK08_15220 [Leptobacterium flavescens]|uniref:Uncharacterized protein n=1 Tax=Leptobacterium flavescens TaxID=472055 RepID=A0A6P0UWJ4_9FLAO|nr:hypothetical protein [Leptobacterium flavescens]NER14806.1 hypothetical protein [Leptobacterium flavescens]
MKSFLSKISAFLLALLVLMSTVSFTVHNHYCGTFLVNTSVLGEADNCKMMMAVKDTSGSCAAVEKSCCTDEVLHVEGQDELKLSFSDLDLDQQQFLISFVYSFQDLFEGLEENIIPFRDYSPPPLIRDIQVLHETYLI